MSLISIRRSSLKKAVALLLVLMLCLAMAASAVAQDYDSAIDAAFDAGQLILKEKAFPLPDPDSCMVILPKENEDPETGDLYFTDEEFRQSIKDGCLTIMAYSPDGKTAVGYLDLAEKDLRVPVALSDNRITMIHPLAGRGAEIQRIADEEDTMTGAAQYYFRYYYTQGISSSSSRTPASQMPMGIDATGLTWSPDGRYYYAGNYNELRNTLSVHVIIDTQTGEMISVDTFGGIRDQNNPGLLYSGCFSEDGKYFYGAVYGGKYGGSNFPIVRYDLDTFETVLLAAPAVSLTPPLITLRDGTILAVTNPSYSSEAVKLLWIRPDGTTTEAEYPYPSGMWQARQIEYSPVSGYAVVWQDSKIFGMYRTARTGSTGLYIFRPEENKADGLESALFIDNDTGKPITDVVADHLFILDDAGQIAKAKEYENAPYQVLDVELSPGGRYAAVLLYRLIPAQSQEPELHLMVIRLEDRAYLIAEGLDLIEDPARARGPKGSNLNTRYNSRLPILNWTEAGLLTIDTQPQLWQIGE